METGKPVVIVRTADGMIGLLVDELLGRQEIVIKPLGRLSRWNIPASAVPPSIRKARGSCVGSCSIKGARAHAAAVSELPSDATASADSLVPYAKAPEPNASKQSLLLIDDSLSIRKFVGRMLESAGYEVDTAVDGEDGLRKASTQNYRLIITDLEMPKLNGYEVIQGLRSRAQTQQTPIIVMTTRAGDKHQQMALNIGASSYIAKR